MSKKKTAQVRLVSLSAVALESIDFDVVFVHGLGGDCFKSWSFSGSAESWSDWLSADFPTARIWTLDYPANSTRWTSRGPGMTLPERAAGVIEVLLNHGIGQRPVIFICHSLGGLLVKQILRYSTEFSAPNWNDIASATVGVVFLATPHQGSNLANFIKHVPFLRATRATIGLRADCPHLNDLYNWYRMNAAKLEIKTLAFRENIGLNGGLIVVNPARSDPGIDGVVTVPVDEDHSSIAKPATKSAPVYMGVERFIMSIGLNQGSKQSASITVGLRPGVAGAYRARPNDDLLATGAGGIAVVSGLGGTGKTQLALRYFESSRLDSSHSLYLWITASSRRAVLESYSAAMDRLKVASGGRLRSSANESADEFLIWLGDNPGWVIVLDDLVDASLMNKLWPPRTGQVIITTNRLDLRPPTAFDLIKMEVFTRVEALQYLSVKCPKDNPEDLTDLAKELGYLPLALAQAVAYMDTVEITAAEYLQALNTQHRRLGDLFPISAPADEYDRTVETTWQIAIAAANKRFPVGVAVRLLEVISWLDPNGVPSSIVTAMATRQFLSSRVPANVSPPHVSEFDIDQSLGVLKSFNLISVTEALAPTASKTIRVHRLVQRAVRELADKPTESLTAVIEATIEAWPVDPRLASNKEQNASFQRNAEHLRSSMQQYGLIDDEMLVRSVSLLARLGRSFEESPEDARNHWQKLLPEIERTFGVASKQALEARNYLAQALQRVGQVNQAIKLFEANLAIDQAQDPIDGGALSSSLNNLASAYESRGDSNLAEPLYRRAYTLSCAGFGESSLQTLQTLDNWASCLSRGPDAGAAIPIATKAYRGFAENLGELHPDSLVAGNNLACAYQNAGRQQRNDSLLRDAADLFLQNADMRSEVFGLTDYRTLVVRCNLVTVMFDLLETTGDSLYRNRARNLVKEVLEILIASADSRCKPLVARLSQMQQQLR